MLAELDLLSEERRARTDNALDDRAPIGRQQLPEPCLFPRGNRAFRRSPRLNPGYPSARSSLASNASGPRPRT